MTEPQGKAELTAQQEAALGAKVRLIEAGPGAGKTKTVVARLRIQAASGRRVALLSFTNAAVNVARSRCRDVPGLLEPPNFIGTFDLFFHRYVLTPFIRQKTGAAPTYLSSWDDLPLHRRVVRPRNGGTGVRLSRFQRQDDGRWAVNELSLSRNERLAWDGLTDWGRNDINETGSARIKALHVAYVYDTSEARRRALIVLKKTDDVCLKRLATRFQEVIVDEFQDCDDIEYKLLGCLRDAGIHVVVVADPDQAIYEFRQSSTGLYEGFRGNLDADAEIVSLTTCFRSTPAICSLVTSLRSIGSSAITSDPNHVGGPELIHLVAGTKIEAGRAALKIARAHGIKGAGTRVIAHRRADARALLRAGKQPPGGVGQMEDLLSALAELRSSADSRGRLAATRRVEALILSQFAWDTDAAEAANGSGKRHLDARADQLAALEIEPEQLRVVVARLLEDSHAWTDANACKKSVRATYESFAAARSVELQPGIGHRLVIPKKVWDFWESRTEGMLVGGEVEGVRWGHVHGVKGEEYDAVILAIPSRRPGGAPHVLDDWENDQNSEARRVMYVGASRARKLLILVVPPGLGAQAEKILKSSNVSYAITVAD